MVFSIVVMCGDTVVVVSEVDVEVEMDVVVVDVVATLSETAGEDVIWDAFILNLFLSMVSLLLNGETIKFSKFLMAMEVAARIFLVFLK